MNAALSWVYNIHMESLSDDLKKGKLHHAYLIEGDKNAPLKLLDFFQNEMGFQTRGNPDFWHSHFGTFGIEEGRMLKEMQLRKAAAGERKIFVVSFDFITKEAQNSLLKVIEEPTANTHFFFFTPTSESLLATLQSRMVIIRAENLPKRDRSLAKKFISAPIPERLSMLHAITEAKDKSGALSFLDLLELELRENISRRFSNSAEIFIFEQIIQCRKYLYDRAPSVKMLIEHLSIIVPIVK